MGVWVVFCRTGSTVEAAAPTAGHCQRVWLAGALSTEHPRSFDHNTLSPVMCPTMLCCAVLCSRLNERVKMVGPVVSCVPAPLDPQDPSAPWAYNPHIPFHALAVDRCGAHWLQRCSERLCVSARLFAQHLIGWVASHLYGRALVWSLQTLGHRVPVGQSMADSAIAQPPQSYQQGV